MTTIVRKPRLTQRTYRKLQERSAVLYARELERLMTRCRAIY